MGVKPHDRRGNYAVESVLRVTGYAMDSTRVPEEGYIHALGLTAGHITGVGRGRCKRYSIDSDDIHDGERLPLGRSSPAPVMRPSPPIAASMVECIDTYCDIRSTSTVLRSNSS